MQYRGTGALKPSIGVLQQIKPHFKRTLSLAIRIIIGPGIMTVNFKLKGWHTVPVCRDYAGRITQRNWKSSAVSWHSAAISSSAPRAWPDGALAREPGLTAPPAARPNCHGCRGCRQRRLLRFSLTRSLGSCLTLAIRHCHNPTPVATGCHNGPHLQLRRSTRRRRLSQSRMFIWKNDTLGKSGQPGISQYRFLRLG